MVWQACALNGTSNGSGWFRLATTLDRGRGETENTLDRQIIQTLSQHRAYRPTARTLPINDIPPKLLCYAQKPAHGGGRGGAGVACAWRASPGGVAPWPTESPGGAALPQVEVSKLLR